MTEHQFFQIVNTKARETGLNPLILLSGIEALHTFKDLPLNQINYDLLDSLIITIFTLRIGDQFHALAEENLSSTNPEIQLAAIHELSELNGDEIASSNNRFLQSFAQMIQGKAVIRRYHEKALEVAALEVHKAQSQFSQKSIGIITMDICKSDVGGVLDLGIIFGAA